MRKIKIKPELLSLLTSGAFNQFTSKALIKAYRSTPDNSDLSQRQAQQFILRNIERLTWAGLVSKDTDNEGKQAVYTLTNRFAPENYDIGTPHRKAGSTPVIKATTPSPDPLIQLREQLSAHKLELMTTIAETEEYEELCKQLPSKQTEIQELYNDARNRYSKTLGKVKAIESLILRTGNHQQ